MSLEKDDLLKQARNTDIYQVLAYYGTYGNQYNKFHCIYHNDKTPSASIKNNRYKCFSCGRKNSSLDIAMYKENISDPRAAAMKVLEISNQNIEIKTIEEKTNTKYNKKERKTLTFDDRIKIIDFNNTIKIEEYLQSRAIDPRVLKVLDRQNIRYGVDKLGQINFFFLKGKFAIYRSLNNHNYNCGTPQPACLKVNSSKEWYITEGLFDALTLVDLNKNVICLNSVNQVNNFMKSINVDKKDFKYIIAVDSDERGFEALEKLSEFFLENELDFDVYDKLIGSGCKDINEMRMKGLI